MRKHGNYSLVRPSGIGLLCGQNSQEFLIAIDCDGFSAHSFVLQISGGQPLPKTVAFTSGRLGRCQYLFRVPGTNWQLKSRRFNTGMEESLELRGTGMQSILPPSPHALTGKYRWVSRCSPDMQEVAIAPDWLIKLMTKPSNRRVNFPTINTYKTTKYTHSCNKINITHALLLLEVIHPKFANNYHSWIMIGMALKYISQDLLWAWDKWSQLSAKYVAGECNYKWGNFQGTGISDRSLIFFANQS